MNDAIQNEQKRLVEFIRRIFQDIQKQVTRHYGSEQPIQEFTSLVQSFNLLKEKVPGYNKKYLSPQQKGDIVNLQTLSDKIKTILIKSTKRDSKYIGKTCEYLDELTQSFSEEEKESLFTDQERLLLKELKLLCKDHTLQEFVTIDFLPSSLKTLEDAGNDQVYESHYQSFQLLFDLMIRKKQQELREGGLSKIEQTRLFPLYSYDYVRNVQKKIEKEFEPHKQTLYQNSWSIDQFRHSLTTVLHQCEHIDVESVNGTLFNCKIEKDRFILKTNKPRGHGNPSILHEFVIGSWLNQIRNVNPGLMFTYGGFFCSPFDTEIRDLCSIEYDKVALTTILITEFIDGKPLKSFANSPLLPQLLKQVFYTLQIAYFKFRFCHNDLHCGNILVRELPEHVVLSYSNIKVHTNMIPTLIDFGTSTIDIKIKNGNMLSLYCFPTEIGQQEQPTIESKVSQYGVAGYPSYDWLRLLISLSPYTKNPNVLLPFVQPFIDYKLDNIEKYNSFDPTAKWIEDVQNNTKCTSFIPQHKYPFFYEFNIYKSKKLF